VAAASPEVEVVIGSARIVVRPGFDVELLQQVAVESLPMPEKDPFGARTRSCAAAIGEGSL
jgi:hypothetical protein